MVKMSMKDRTLFLKRVIAQLVVAHGEYSKQEGELVRENDEFWKAADTLVQAFSWGAIPAECREIFDAVQPFAKSWSTWSHEVKHSPTPDYKPPQAVWSNYEAVKRAMIQTTRPPLMLPTIAELKEQNVPLHQVCDMYKWYKNGTQDIGKARDAFANPEKYDNMEDRQPEEIEKKRKEVFWDAYAKRLAGMEMINWALQQMQKGIDPETSERSQTNAYGEELSFEERYMSEVMDTEQPQATAEDFAYAGEKTLEEQVIELLDNGVNDDEIKGLLEISGQKLAAIKRHREQIAADSAA